MAIKLASLFLELGARGDKLLAELTKTEKEARSWSGRMNQATKLAAVGFGGIAVAAGATATALAGVYSASAPQIAAQQKLADRLDTTSAELKILEIASRGTAGGLEGMNDTLSDFVERLGEAKVDGGEPAEALDLLGLSVDDLAAKDPSRALRDVLDAMAGIPDAGVRAATAAKLFGDAGIALTTNAEGLSRAIEESERKLEALGGALTEFEARGVVEAQAAVSDLGLIADIAGDKVAARLAPVVRDLARDMFDAATDTIDLGRRIDEMIDGALHGLSAVASGVASGLDFVSGSPAIVNFGIVGAMLFGAKGAVVGAGVGLLFEEVIDYIQLFDDVVETVYERFTGKALDVPDLIDDLIRPKLPEFLGVTGDALLVASIRAGDLATSLDRARLSVGEFEGLVEGGAGGDGSARAAEAAARAAEAAEQRKVDAARKAETDRVSLAREAALEMRKLREEQLTENKLYHGELFNAYARYQDSRMEYEQNLRVDDQRDYEIALLDGYFKERTDQEKTFQNTWATFQAAGAEDRLSILANETGSALEILSQHDKKLFGAMKVANYAKALVSIATGAARALELPFPANIAAAATVVANGAAQLLTIKTTEFGGGGSVPAPNGSAGGSVEVPEITGGTAATNIPGAAAANDAGRAPPVVHLYADQGALTPDEEADLVREGLLSLQESGEVEYAEGMAPTIIRHPGRRSRRRAA